ncbi:DUF4843 domain-containing protein [Flavobacterium hungaricum]|uniref:DUF4843 domain-containing protein n=1 Tax=Flavobacterium hungaricum TaxID=2082725 RepID=A0ABR9TNB9_9FLAO|nr:DUF4843 domain-containing protein [Flavobacterium hungaricum]MBE8726855.1 DUF4843 domain-containing protein [Flavobacterium hungaricum]
MKKILILSIIFVSFLGFTSCEKEEIKAYEDTDNIYFSNAMFAPNKVSAPLIDSTGFSFGLDNPAITQRIFKIPIRVQGRLSDVDRKVKLTVDPTSTAVEGTHFSLPENIVMHAGQEVDTIEVTVLRAPDMKTNAFTLVLNLEENEFFTTKMQTKVVNALTQKTMSFIRYKLTFDDKLTQPSGWYAPYLGVFTAKKFFLMCGLMDLDPSMFAQKLGAPGLSIPEVTYYQNFMQRYLADQKKSGNTVYEDDGTEMSFP